MPRIPEAAVTVPLRAPPMPSVGPGGVGSERILGAIAGFMAKREEAQRKAEFVKLSGEMTGAIADLQLEIERDPEANTVEIAEARFAEGSETIISEVINSARSKQVQDALQARATELGLSGRISVGKTAFQREIDTGRAGTIAALEQEVRAYALAESDEERAFSTKRALVAINLPEYFSEQEQRELERDWDARAQTGRVVRLIDLERFDEAQTLLDDREKLLGLDEKQRETLENTLDVAVAQKESEVRARATSDLAIRVSRAEGQPPAVLDALEEEVRQAAEDKAISFDARTQLVLKLDKHREIFAESAEAHAFVESVVSGERVMDFRDADSKKKVDLVWEKSIAPRLAGQPYDVAAEVGAQFSDDIGWMPRAVQGVIRGGLRAGTPEQAALAADIVDRLARKNEQVLEDFADKDIDAAMSINVLTEGMVAPAQAVEEVRRGIQQSSAEKDVRKAEFAQSVTDEKNKAWLDDRLDGWGWDPEIPSAAVENFRYLVEVSHAATGQMEGARRSAADRWRRIWHPTDIDGGEKRYMRYSPEGIYGQPGFGTNEMREQLLEDLQEPGAFTPAIESLKTVRLVPDLATSREAHPSYQVWVYPENDPPLILKRNDEIWTWYPDYETSPAARRRAEETKGRIATAKQKKKVAGFIKNAWINARYGDFGGVE